jgi:hypothetical protein
MFKAKLILIALLFGMLMYSVRMYGQDLPVKEEGRLIVFQSSSMRCAIYINEAGTTHGTATMSCVDLPFDEAIDNSIRILDVKKTTDTKQLK